MLLWPKIGIHDQDTIRCYGRLLGEEGGGGGSTVQAATAGHSGSVDIDVFGVVIRSIMILFLLVRLLVQLVELHKECLPRTRLTGEMVARTRFLVNMCLLCFRHGSLQLKMLGLAMLFRGLLVCVLIWCENC